MRLVVYLFAAWGALCAANGARLYLQEWDEERRARRVRSGTLPS